MPDETRAATPTSPESADAGCIRYNSTFSPVIVSGKETTGAFFLGVLAIILTIALLRAQARNRELEVQLVQR